ncbi:MAG: exonuclease domain-containing protein [Desulfatirhabdiaceae bacterium]
MDSHKKFWLFVAISATITAAVFVSLASLFWSQFTPEEQHQLIELVHRHMVYVLGMVVMFIGGWIVWLDAVLYTYVLPTVQIADETLMIYTVNPSHRIKIDASRDMNRLAGLINEGADRYEALFESVEDKIRQARQEVEQDKNVLAAIVGQLPEGIVICNPSGSILLFNKKAQELLTVREKSCQYPNSETLSGPFLGLGRNISSVIDPVQIDRAVSRITRKLHESSDDPKEHPPDNPVSFFSITGPMGNQLSVEMVPILNQRQQLAGLILIIHDLTQALTLEARRTVMQVLSGFQEGLDEIWSSVETLLAHSQTTSFHHTQVLKLVYDQTCRMKELIRLSSSEPVDFQTISPITLMESSRPEFYDFDLFNRPDASPELQDNFLTDISYTVFDTETTGLDPRTDEIISIGAVRIVNNRLLREDVFNMLVDPKRAVGAESIRVHGIQPEMLQGQPPITVALSEFRRFSENTVLIGHNAAFDMRMFQIKEAVTGIRFTQPVLDTMFLSAVLHPAHRYHSLEAIAERLGLCIRGRHTALGDSMATAEIFLKFVPLLARKNILTLRDAILASQKTDYARIRY